MTKTFHARSALLAALVVTLLVTVASAGCGTTSAGTPSQIIKKAIDAQGRLKSVTVDYESDVDLGLPGGNRSSSVSYKGSFQQPDRWKLAIRSSGVKSEVVIVGQKTWVKLPGSDTWTVKNTSSPLIGSSPDDVVASKYLKSAKNVQMVDQKDNAYHMKFDLDLLTFARAFNLSGIDPALFKGKVAHLDVWVRKKDMFLQKATMNFASQLGAPVNGSLKMSTEIDFSNFNEPVSVEPPT
jgi:hypothetical protein